MARFVKEDRSRELATGAPPRARRGMVLILVLIVVVMIALAGFGFSELMLTENKATHLHGEELELDQAIGSGTEFLQFFCEQPLEEQEMAGGLFRNPSAFQNVSLLREDRRSRVAPHQARFSIVAPPLLVKDENLRREPEIRFGVDNESGKLHLADLLRWEQQKPGSGRESLMHLPGMTDAVADAILDWIDTDTEQRPMGAESDYYGGLPRPYAPRNGLPECLEELLLVKGVTREMLFGPDTENKPRWDDEEEDRAPRRQSAARGNATGMIPWISLLTLYSGYRNVTAAGQPRIDLNAPSLPQLQSQLSAALDPNWAAFIIAYRQYGPSLPGNTPAISAPPPIDTTVAARAQISSVLDLAGAQVAIPGKTPQEAAKIYLSPMSEEPSSLGQHLPALLDKTTVIPLPVVRGGVSVNDAPPAVLACVPGIDEALAGRIAMGRGAQSAGGNTSRRFATWILSEGLVDLPTMKKLMPNLTGGGDVIRAQVIGHFSDRGPTASADVIIDATARPARQVFWRDRRFWGSSVALEQLNGAETEARGAR